MLRSMWGENPTIGQGTEKFIQAIRSANEKGLMGKLDIGKLAKGIGEVDARAIEAAKHMQQTSGSIDEFNRTVGTAIPASERFGKALKDAAINMGVMIAVMAAIKLGMWIFDQLNTTMEEQQETVDNLTEKVQGLKDEYDELSGRNNLTEAEKQKLDYLERQLTVNEQLLKQEQKKLGTVIFLVGQFVPFEFSKISINFYVQEKILDKYKRSVYTTAVANGQVCFYRCLQKATT